jgi:predicted acetylornithine/succinylornithine family transaminase
MENIDNNAAYNRGGKYLMNTYSRLPIVFNKASLQYLWDVEGKKYLDFIAGYGCLNVGHSNKSVIKALQKQVSALIQPSNVYYNIPQIELARKICEITGFGQKVFFANSGTESIEAALKLARKYSEDKYNSERFEVITFKRSFHGRTMGALSATAQPKKQKMFKPLLKGFLYGELNNIDSVKDLVSDNTCAVMLEPVQGESGVYPADMQFMKDLRDLCTQKDILLILDEVQTGFARTGKMFAYENYDIQPDILVLAKSLGGGMPIGAIVANDEISNAFAPGMHGSTFGGNAASCAAAIAVIDYIKENDLTSRSAELGNHLLKGLKKLKGKYSAIKEVRGLGLMAAMELEDPVAAKIIEDGLKDGLVLNRVSDYTLRFLPPLIIKKANIDYLLKWLNKKIGEI